MVMLAENSHLNLRVVALVFALLFCASVTASEPVDFEVATDSGSLSAESMRGNVVYIDFWASWCTPCRASFPWMNEMHEKYAEQGLRIVAVNLDKERSLSEQFLSELPAKFTIGYDPSAKLAEQFGLVGMPSAYILNRDGELIAKHVGFRKAKMSEYEHSIAQALQSN